MKLQDMILFNARTLRSSLDILVRAARTPEPAGADEQDFLRKELPLAIEDAEEALKALEALASDRTATQDSDAWTRLDPPRARRG